MFDNENGHVILCGFGSAFVAEIEFDIRKRLDIR